MDIITKLGYRGKLLYLKNFFPPFGRKEIRNMYEIEILKKFKERKEGEK